MPETPAVDFSQITNLIGEIGPLVLAAVGLVMAAGVSVGIVIWAWPKFLGLFKRTAK